ncbi:metalloregulator ArsR/SmtB family transcription factor [Patescibacteria group bacterium]|nr:metalloregulator ArsR/SmtB family transcription factor [Patescibacteria group bacterium]MBU4115784.1 metalloregulator ArsR/SmtB family transcription factor [Patescibacteria group bacterium]
MNYKEAEKIHKALANQRRLMIIHLLSKNGNMSVGDISEKIRLSFKATSKHMLILKNANIVDNEQVGLEQFYFLKGNIDPIIKKTISTF